MYTTTTSKVVEIPAQRVGNQLSPQAQRPEEMTWHNIRVNMSHTYGKWYTARDLKEMENKWRRIFSDAGWSMKGM